MTTTINERSQLLLKMLIERYIADGHPVGSKFLATCSSLNVSSATIRSILADLEERGFLRSPHTSAGRVPTTAGYRFFIDSLLTVKNLDADRVERFAQALNPDQDQQGLLQSASQLLSSITQLAGLVTLPRKDKVLLRHIEFLPLTSNRVLVIFVLDQKEVQNRIIHTDRIYTAQELEQVGNYLTREYAGRDLQSIRQLLLNAMHDDRRRMDELMKMAIHVADQALYEQPQEDYVMAGQTNLLGIADEKGVDHLRALFNAFTEKQHILRLLDHCLQAEDMQIFLGDESKHDVLEGCALVSAPYRIDGAVVGVLGVIGPSRMAYEEIIPVVDVTAKILSSALNKTK